MDMNGILGKPEQSRRRRCAYCSETLDPEDRRSIWLPGRGSSGHFCSDDCLRRFQERAAGKEVEPYYGEKLDLGNKMLHASEDPD